MGGFMTENQSPVSAPDQHIAPSAPVTMAHIAAQTRQAQAPESVSGPAEAQQVAPGAPETDQQQDSFFDPADVPQDLDERYKAMQAAYTRKTQEIAAQRRKIEAYDQFAADPVSALQAMAEQYGFSLTRGQAQAAIQQQGQQQQEWQPQTWDEVLQKAEERAMQRLTPLVQHVQKLQANSIESQLDRMDPNWRIYEDDMRQLLKKHPSLANDPNLLYRTAVPTEVIEGRAAKKALEKLKGHTESARVSRSGFAAGSSSAPQSIKTFQDAVNEARRRVGEAMGGR